MKLSLFTDYEPIALYTYETASARAIVVRIEDAYSEISDYVTKHFGRDKMDNKITLILTNEDGKYIYATYWDGTLSIGCDVYFLADIIKPENKYRTVFPKKQNQ